MLNVTASELAQESIHIKEEYIGKEDNVGHYITQLETTIKLLQNGFRVGPEEGRCDPIPIMLLW